MFFVAIIAWGIWWAYDKTEEIGRSLTKTKKSQPKYQFHDEF